MNRLTTALAIFAVACCNSQFSFRSVANETQQREYPSVYVVIAPDKLLPENQISSQQRLFESVGRRFLDGQSEVIGSYRIQAVPSNRSAKLLFRMVGQTSGSSTTSVGRRQVESLNQSNFTVHQMIELTSDRVSIREPRVQADSDRQITYAISDRALLSPKMATFLVRTGFVLFRGVVLRESAEFTEGKIRNQVVNSGREIETKLNQWLVSANDWLENEADLDLCTLECTSTNRVIRLRSEATTVATNPPKLHVVPISVRVHENVVNDTLKTMLGGKTFDSAKLDKAIQSIAPNIFETESENPDSDWSIAFDSDRPIHVSANDKRIRIELNGAKFVSTGRQVSGMRITSTYRLVFKDKQWFLWQVEPVDVFPIGKQNSLGARQQVLRSIMKRRFARLLPKKIKIPVIDVSNFRTGANRFSTFGSPMKIELAPLVVAADQGWIAISLDHAASNRLSE